MWTDSDIRTRYLVKHHFDRPKSCDILCVRPTYMNELPITWILSLFIYLSHFQPPLCTIPIRWKVMTLFYWLSSLERWGEWQHTHPRWMAETRVKPPIERFGNIFIQALTHVVVEFGNHSRLRAGMVLMGFERQSVRAKRAERKKERPTMDRIDDRFLASAFVPVFSASVL